jgi:OOP family OmpA-OmpF porin
MDMANKRFSLFRTLTAALTGLLLAQAALAQVEGPVYPTLVNSGNGVLHNNFGECWGTGPNNVTSTPPTECSPAKPASKAAAVATAPQPSSTTVTFSAEVLFDFDKSTLKPAGKEAIDGAVANAGTDSIKSIRVDGYTDGVGSDGYNQKLSIRRALAVKKYLDSKGLAVNIQAVGHGKSDPVAGNDTAQGRSKNRRAEITFEK